MAAIAHKPWIPRGIERVNWMFGAWTGIILLFLYLPIALLVIYSFNTSRLNVQWEGFTFQWYESLLGNKTLLDALKNSLIVASFTTVFAVILGTLGAWLLYRYRYPATRTVQTLVFIPMVIPEVIMGISLLALFALVQYPLGYVTIIIAHTTFCFPFVLVAVQARLSGLDPNLEEAALDLGATPLQAFGLIIVPYLLPAIISGTLMSFTLSLDEYIVTVFTTGPASQTLPIKIFGMAKKGLDPSLNAVSTLFVAATVLFVLAGEYIRKRQPA
jgi:spermidine/putrescine transport system permease protein